jgi:hypothetical protein
MAWSAATARLDTPGFLVSRALRALDKREEEEAPRKSRCHHAREWKDEVVVTIWPAKARERLEDAAHRELARIPKIDAVYLFGADDERQLIVVVQEHEMADWDRLLEVERKLKERFGYVEICVRAHQGRGLAAYQGLSRVL